MTENNSEAAALAGATASDAQDAVVGASTQHSTTAAPRYINLDEQGILVRHEDMAAHTAKRLLRLVPRECLIRVPVDVLAEDGIVSDRPVTYLPGAAVVALLAAHGHGWEHAAQLLVVVASACGEDVAADTAEDARGLLAEIERREFGITDQARMLIANGAEQLEHVAARMDIYDAGHDHLAKAAEALRGGVAA